MIIYFYGKLWQLSYRVRERRARSRRTSSRLTMKRRIKTVRDESRHKSVIIANSWLRNPLAPTAHASIIPRSYNTRRSFSSSYRTRHFIRCACSLLTLMSSFRTNVLEAVQVVRRRLVFLFLRFLQAGYRPFCSARLLIPSCDISDLAAAANVFVASSISAECCQQPRLLISVAVSRRLMMLDLLIPLLPGSVWIHKQSSSCSTHEAGEPTFHPSRQSGWLYYVGCLRRDRKAPKNGTEDRVNLRSRGHLSRIPSLVQKAAALRVARYARIRNILRPRQPETGNCR